MCQYLKIENPLNSHQQPAIIASGDKQPTTAKTENSEITFEGRPSKVKNRDCTNGQGRKREVTAPLGAHNGNYVKR